MFFHFTGLKDISEKNYTLDLLIEAEDIAIVKDFLASQKVITLGLEHYTGSVEDFGNIFMHLIYKDAYLKVIAHFETVEEVLKYAVKLDLDVKDANYLQGQQMSSEAVQQMLSKFKSQNQARLEQEKKEKEKAEQQVWSAFFDKKLKKAYEAIDEIINQIDQILAIGKNKIDPMSRKKLDDMRWNISKLRLATNYDNIVEELHGAMDLIVATQDVLLERLESEQVFSIFKKSQITNVDVIREQTRLAKANLLQALWAQLTREETMYVSLGHLKFFSQYLYRDIAVVLQDKLIFVKQLFKGLEVMALFVMLEIALMVIFSPFLWLELSLERFWIIFMYVAIFGLLIGGFNYLFSPRSLQEYGFYGVGIVLVYMVLMWGIKLLLLF